MLCRAERILNSAAIGSWCCVCLAIEGAEVRRLHVVDWRRPSATAVAEPGRAMAAWYGAAGREPTPQLAAQDESRQRGEIPGGLSHARLLGHYRSAAIALECQGEALANLALMPEYASSHQLPAGKRRWLRWSSTPDRWSPCSQRRRAAWAAGRRGSTSCKCRA